MASFQPKVRCFCAPQERLPQSDIRSAYQKASLNGDGFGVGWYVAGRVERGGRSSNLSFLRAASEVRTPASASATSDAETAAGNDGWEDDCGACVFTSLKPAWADRNLFNLAEKVCVEPGARLLVRCGRQQAMEVALAECALAFGVVWYEHHFQPVTWCMLPSSSISRTQVPLYFTPLPNITASETT